MNLRMWRRAAPSTASKENSALQMRGLAEFQSQKTSGLLSPGHIPLADGIWLHSDEELQIEGRYSSPAGRLLELDATPKGDGAWFAMHFDLPSLHMQDLRYFGLVCRSSAPEPFIMHPCLRSGVPENEAGSGFVDCFFDKHIVPGVRAQTHMDCLYLDSLPSLPFESAWRQLVLFFPRSAFRMSLLHLHTFVI